jgi:hypothetical protein
LTRPSARTAGVVSFVAPAWGRVVTPWIHHGFTVETAPGGARVAPPPGALRWVA